MQKLLFFPVYSLRDYGLVKLRDLFKMTKERGGGKSRTQD